MTVIESDTSNYNEEFLDSGWYLASFSLCYSQYPSLILQLYAPNTILKTIDNVKTFK